MTAPEPGAAQRDGSPDPLPTRGGTLGRSAKTAPPAYAAPALSIVVPVRDEAAGLIVVDGGSRDGTVEIARARADRVVTTAPGRARQMNAGLTLATGDVVLFLHADTILPDGALEAIGDGMAREGRVWRRFDVRIEGRSPLLPVVAALMNLRSRLTGIATGDQAIFVRRSILDCIVGLPAIAIMEDIALSRARLRIGRPLCLRARVTTSGRRWDANGALRTIATMWSMRAGYAAGVPPERLAQLYGRLRRG